MRIALDRHQFRLADLLRAVNVGHQRLTTTTVMNWLKLGYLEARKGTGSGRRRLYSAMDAIEVAALFHMTSVGVALQAAAKALEYFRERASFRTMPQQVWRATEPLFRIFIYHDSVKGEHVFISSAAARKTDKWNEELHSRLLDPAPAYICVNVDSIIDGVYAELSKVVAERSMEHEQEDVRQWTPEEIAKVTKLFARVRELVPGSVPEGTLELPAETTEGRVAFNKAMKDLGKLFLRMSKK